MLDALKRSARPLLLLSVALGVAVFATLPLVAPHFASARALPEKVQLSLLASLGVLLTASGWIAIQASMAGASGRQKQRGSGVKRRDEALVTDLGSEPLLREMSDAEAAALRVADTGGDAVGGNSGAANFPSASSSQAARRFSDIDSLAARVRARRPSGGGQRTLITGADETVIPFDAAVEFVQALGDGGAQTILVDWSPRGAGFAGSTGMSLHPGWNELLAGKARFEEIIHRLHGTRAHFISSGDALPDGGAAVDTMLLNLALDALDEAYDFIVVTGRHAEARVLFETIEGRFDAGILVDPRGYGDTHGADESTFLGFEVVDIDILRYQRPEGAASPFANRIARATRLREPTDLSR